MAVEAKYLGYHENEGYWVNVRNAKPTGKAGDGGVIRRFETEEEAKAYMQGVNDCGEDTFMRSVNYAEEPVRHEGDEFVEEDKENQKNYYTEPPEISWIRAVTGILTYDQVDAINESRRLPDNVKFMMNGSGGYSISYNYFNIRPGTQTLPKGFEVKKDILGFVHVVPTGTTGWFY